MTDPLNIHPGYPRQRQASLFDDQRLTLADSIALTAESLALYGANYRHWCIAYSGGKDSTATVTVVARLLAIGAVPPPETLTIMLADTRMELPPLMLSALGVLAEMRRRGHTTRVVLPPIDDRFFVYVLGRGVPPPSNTFRWCTPRIKIEPMMAELQGLAVAKGLGALVHDPKSGTPRYVPNGDEKLLMLTGVRIGESAARDQRIAVSCSRDGSECGQGWFQRDGNGPLADTLAPLLHWRVCHVWDWLMFTAPSMGFPTHAVAEAYGGDEAEELNARTGCVGCNLASRDTALDAVLDLPQWAYLAPFKRLRPLYAELKKPAMRLRKDGSERRRDGTLVSNPQRMGPLTFEARRWGLAQVLGLQGEINEAARVQGRPEVYLIDEEEHARIEELITAETWPQGWDGSESRADVWRDQVKGEGVIQPLLASMRSDK